VQVTPFIWSVAAGVVVAAKLLARIRSAVAVAVVVDTPNLPIKQ